MGVTQYFDRGWALNPEGVAFVAGDRRWTHDEFRRLTSRIGNALVRSGAKPGARMAVLAVNDPMAWACVVGGWRAGLAWVPLNPATPAEELAGLLTRFRADIVFFHALFAPMVAALRPHLPGVGTWVCIDGSSDGIPSLEAFTEDSSEEPPVVPIDPEDIAGVSPTGGTTGVPKGVLTTHRGIMASMSHLAAGLSYPEAIVPVNLAAAPMTHSAGLLTLPTTARGGTVVVLTKADAPSLVQAIAANGVTEVFLPPTVIYRLLDAADQVAPAMRSLHYMLYGAAPMSVEKLKRAIAVFGPIMFGGYGQTEAPLTISSFTPAEHFIGGKLGGELVADSRLASVGKPGPLVRVRILDDQGTVLEADERGEICVQGDLLMAGYDSDPEQTAATIIDGWLHTGDIGFLDEDGYLSITDRKKDMIVSGGFNVYPIEVEQVLWSHPAVEDCAVIGVPDADWGEAVKAVVEFTPGVSATPEELIALCKQKLGSQRAPKSVDIVETLPRSAAGKVLKRELRAPYWAGRERGV